MAAMVVAAAREFRPDVIVCDIAMPEMDGYSCWRCARVRDRSGAVHLLTARSDRAFMRHGMELGADDCLTKPFSAAELLRDRRASSAAT